jgi:hypothetical protein
MGIKPDDLLCDHRFESMHDGECHDQGGNAQCHPDDGGSGDEGNEGNAVLAEKIPSCQITRKGHVFRVPKLCVQVSYAGRAARHEYFDSPSGA